MTTISLHDVDPVVYDNLGVLEVNGPTARWKQLHVGDVKLVFFPEEPTHRHMHDQNQDEVAPY